MLNERQIIRAALKNYIKTLKQGVKSYFTDSVILKTERLANQYSGEYDNEFLKDLPLQDLILLKEECLYQVNINRHDDGSLDKAFQKYEKAFSIIESTLEKKMEHLINKVNNL